MRKNRGRQYSVRESKKTILIMCEGHKTERIYFNALKGKLRAGYIEIISDKNQGLTAEAMLRELKRRKKIGRVSDEVFCVFDLDVHGQAHNEIVTQLQMWPRSLVRVVPSRPCFEY